MSVVRADRFTALKEKVKAEMLRRNQDGTVEDYGGAAYDYTVEPAAGKTIRAAHRDKLVPPMRAVAAGLVPRASRVSTGRAPHAEFCALTVSPYETAPLLYRRF